MQLLFGFRDGKSDVKNVLQKLMQESSSENVDLRQRLLEIRWQLQERANRL
jgi:hypothetical protein